MRGTPGGPCSEPTAPGLCEGEAADAASRRAVRFFCIGGEDAVRGFGLAGVEGRAVADAAQAAAALDEAAAMEDCGVLIITSSAAAMARAKVDSIRLLMDRPLVVEIEEQGYGNYRGPGRS